MKECKLPTIDVLSEISVCLEEVMAKMEEEEKQKQRNKIMAKELEDQESWTPGDLKKLYPYPCADFRVKKSDNEEVTYLHIRIPLNEATAKADFKRCTNIRETSDGIRSTPEKTRKVD